MNRKTLITLSILAALTAGTALAATDAAPADAKATPRVKLDTNGDGLVDKAEASQFPRLAAKFDEMDKNKDGKLSKEEMPRHERGDGKRAHGPRGEGGRPAMAKLDTDKDGRISRAEASAGEGKLAGRFDALDANKDGFVDRADREIRAKQHRDEWFAAADKDKDGKLSRAELEAAKTSGHAGRGRGEQAPKPAVAPQKN